MQKFNNYHECPHMLKMFDTPTCIIAWKPCLQVEDCPREAEEKEKETEDARTNI